MKNSRRESSSFVGRERKGKIHNSTIIPLKCVIHVHLLFPKRQLLNLTRFNLYWNVCIWRKEVVEVFYVVWHSSPSDPSSPSHQQYWYWQHLHVRASCSPPQCSTQVHAGTPALPGCPRCTCTRSRGIRNTQGLPKIFLTEAGFSSLSYRLPGCLQPTHISLEGWQQAVRAVSRDPELVGDGGTIPGGQLCFEGRGNLLWPWQRTVPHKPSWTLPPLQPRQLSSPCCDALLQLLKGLFTEMW